MKFLICAAATAAMVCATARAADEAEPLAVEWLWSGAVTSSGARVVARIAGEPEGEEAELRAFPEGAGDEAAGVAARRESRADGIAHFSFDGLAPGTRYALRLAWDDGEPAGDGEVLGGFKTLPVEGEPASFSLAFGSCNENPASPAFHAMRAVDPDFAIMTGDFHYSDIGENRIEPFVDAITANLLADPQAEFWRNVPAFYMWDDHDYGPDNSDSTSPSREAARAAYELLVPHYPFALDGEDSGIAQSFTVGRVRFVVTDLRSERLIGNRIMSREQMEWLKSELARAGQSEELVVWVSSIPWNGNDSSADRWSAFPDERREIAEFVRDNGLQGRVVMLAGDAHMCAIDDGSNADFAAGGGGAIPIFHAGAIDRRPSYKGGPYSHGAHPDRLQFGVMEVDDDGERLEVKWSARDASDPAGERVVSASRDAEGPIEYRFTVPARTGGE